MNINSKINFGFSKRSACFFHYVFLLFGFSYSLYQVMYFRYIYLKFLSRPSIMSSSRGVSLDVSLSPILNRFVSSSVLWIFQFNSEFLFCGMYFPWQSCLRWGMGASLWTWFQVCLSTGMASEVIFIWIRLHVSAPVCAHHSRFEFPLHFWELDICLSYFWGWLWIFIIFHLDFIAWFGHIDQRPFYRIVFSISLISYLRERAILRYNLFPL